MAKTTAVAVAELGAAGGRRNGCCCGGRTTSDAILIPPIISQLTTRAEACTDAEMQDIRPMYKRTSQAGRSSNTRVRAQGLSRLGGSGPVISAFAKVDKARE